MLSLQRITASIGILAILILTEAAGNDDEKNKLDDPKYLGVLLVTGLCAVIGLLYILSSNKKKKTVLPLEDFTPFPLIRKDVLSHDTCRFTLGFPAEYTGGGGDFVLGLPIGQHLSLKFTDPETGKAVQRSYTPVTNDTTPNEVQLVIKVYRPLSPKFPKGGLMSQHLDSLKIGDTILVKGPKGHLQYMGKGKFTTKPLGKPKEERSCRFVGMLAGGTGITPMLQLLQAMLVHPEYCDSQTQIKLIYGNQTPQDILVRDELEELAKKYPSRFQLWYTVDRADMVKDWKYDTGFITKEMIEKHLLFDNAKPGNTQFFICGPPPMIKFACLPALQELGYSEKDWNIF